MTAQRAMTPSAINIAIAEWRGFKCFKHSVYGFNVWHHTKFCPPTNPDLGLTDENLPNYYGSLDAIHEAVNALLFSQRQSYYRHLQVVCSITMPGPMLVAMHECIEASAPQRCEALLRTLNLWREE